jgi:hypothetical protein
MGRRMSPFPLDNRAGFKYQNSAFRLPSGGGGRVRVRAESDEGNGIGSTFGSKTDVRFTKTDVKGCGSPVKGDMR